MRLWVVDINDNCLNMEMREKSEEFVPQSDLTLNENRPVADVSSNVSNQSEESVAEAAAEEVVADVPMEVTATETVVVTAAEEPKDEPQQRSLPSTIAETLEAMAALAEKDADEISRNEVRKLHNQFTDLRKAADKPLIDEFVAAGNPAEAFVSPETDDDRRMSQLLDIINEKKAARVAQREQMKQANFEAKEALISEINSMCDDVDNINRQTPRVREIQNEFKAIGDVPEPLASDQWKRYQDACERFYDNLRTNKELRDYDFRKNLEIKTSIIDEAETLADEPDILIAFRRLQDLHNRWRETGPVAKELRDELWMKFKDASTVVNKKYQAYFEERKQREAENEAAKTAICERLEAIDLDAIRGFNAWTEATKVVLQAQEDWKKLGFASKKANNVLFSRFRALCDAFFARKAEYYRTVKDEFAENLRRKTALCEEAESLSDSTDWKATADRLVELQRQWKQIGAVSKKHSDAIWARFQKACDHFFEQKKKDYTDTRHVEQTNLKAKRAIIAELKAIAADMPKEEVLAAIRDAQSRWQGIGHVPYREKDKVYEEFRAAINELYTSHDLRETREQMARFKSSIDEISDDRSLMRERERLARILEAKRGELNTYRNNVGFFNFKSAGSSAMLREIEKKTRRLEEDIRDLEQKITLIDEKL